MVWLIGRKPEVNRPIIWSIAGALVTVPSMFLIDTTNPWLPDRLITAGWLVLA